MISSLPGLLFSFSSFPPFFHDEEVLLKTQYSSGFYPDTDYPATYHIIIVFHSLSEFHPHQRNPRYASYIYLPTYLPNLT